MQPLGTDGTPVNAKHPAPNKSNTGFLRLLVILLIAGLGIIGYVALKPRPKPFVFDPNTPLPKAEGHVRGSDSARVEIVEYGDFECPVCSQFATITEPDVRQRIVDAGLARFRFVDFPLPGHPHTMLAHNAASCAGAQGRFWEMHDQLYERQPEWTGLNVAKPPNAVRIMKLYAKGLGLDTKAFDTCFDSHQFEAQIIANQKQGEALRVNATPTFFVGNQMLNPGTVPYDVLKKLVDSLNALPRKAVPTPVPADSAKKKP